MESFLPVKDHPHLVRDPHSKAINLIDHQVIDKYEQQKEKTLEEQQLKQDVMVLKAEMNDIKQLLIQLVHKVNK